MSPRKGGEKPARSATLDTRQAEVLRRIIHHHILAGEPVGSARVSREMRGSSSPATVRNIMSELEELGFLKQPHTSAGRVPTDRAYRLYVDRMIRKSPSLTRDQEQTIDQALSLHRSEVQEVFGEASRQLSQLSNHVGLVLAPELKRILIDRLEFVRLDESRIMVILVGRSGVVRNRILDMDEPLEQTELDRIGAALSTEFGGRTLPEMRRALERALTADRAAMDRWFAQGLELGRRVFEVAVDDGELIVGGASNLLQSPEFSDPEVVRGLFRTFEQKKRLVELLGRVEQGEGVQVVIGEENSGTNLSRCSLIAAPYGAEERVMGTVGIVGPTRMEYERGMALVDYLARGLTRLLSGRRN